MGVKATPRLACGEPGAHCARLPLRGGGTPGLDTRWAGALRDAQGRTPRTERTPVMNHVSFTCRLTKDPELRHVGTANSHASVVTLRVAVDDRQRSKERPGLFLDIEAWGALATTCGEHLSKGSLIGVSGRLDRDEWQAKDGTPRDRVF